MINLNTEQRIPYIKKFWKLLIFFVIIFFVWRCKSNILKNIGSTEIDIITKKMSHF